MHREQKIFPPCADVCSSHGEVLQSAGVESWARATEGHRARGGDACSGLESIARDGYFWESQPPQVSISMASNRLEFSGALLTLNYLREQTLASWLVSWHALTKLKPRKT